MPRPILALVICLLACAAAVPAAGADPQAVRWEVDPARHSALGLVRSTGELDRLAASAGHGLGLAAPLRIRIVLDGESIAHEPGQFAVTVPAGSLRQWYRLVETRAPLVRDRLFLDVVGWLVLHQAGLALLDMTRGEPPLDRQALADELTVRMAVRCAELGDAGPVEALLGASYFMIMHLDRGVNEADGLHVLTGRKLSAARFRRLACAVLSAVPGASDRVPEAWLDHMLGFNDGVGCPGSGRAEKVRAAGFGE
jgi:hypothetical protein